MNHEHYMSDALTLARRGRGRTSPNPMVGAVIVRNGEVVGEGWHERCGGNHAERNALAAAGDKAAGATLYVTLEPCCHYGKTPPCTEAILEAGIRTVVIGARDPNPLVDGGGIRILREHGVDVVQDVLRDACDELNEVFFHYITQKTPYVVLKYAMTADGKTATRTGASKWITGEASREHVHMSRSAYSAIMVGIGTVLDDDPLLTCRTPGGRNPIRVICDSRLKIPRDAKIVQTAGEIPTYIAAATEDRARQEELEALGCHVIYAPDSEGRVDLTALMATLHGKGIDSVYLEGGGTLAASALTAGIVKRVHVYIAPKLFGGVDAPSPIGGSGVALPSEAQLLKKPRIEMLGDDLFIDYEMRCACVYGNH